MATYTVDYMGPSDGPEVDGVGVRLRVSREGEYWQFFRPLVSGPDLHSVEASSHPSDRWQSALVVAGMDTIQTMAKGGFEPHSDPTQGEIVPVAARTVERIARSDDELPELIDGHEVGRFDGP